MTEKLISTYKRKIQALELIPSDGGCFEVTIDGELVYSKLATGAFPEHPEILKEVEKRLP